MQAEMLNDYQIYIFPVMKEECAIRVGFHKNVLNNLIINTTLDIPSHELSNHDQLGCELHRNCGVTKADLTEWGACTPSSHNQEHTEDTHISRSSPRYDLSVINNINNHKLNRKLLNSASNIQRNHKIVEF